jgi:hypothetical protein
MFRAWSNPTHERNTPLISSVCAYQYAPHEATVPYVCRYPWSVKCLFLSHAKFSSALSPTFQQAASVLGGGWTSWKSQWTQIQDAMGRSESETGDSSISALRYETQIEGDWGEDERGADLTTSSWDGHVISQTWRKPRPNSAYKTISYLSRVIT